MCPALCSQSRCRGGFGTRGCGSWTVWRQAGDGRELRACTVHGSWLRLHIPERGLLCHGRAGTRRRGRERSPQRDACCLALRLGSKRNPSACKSAESVAPRQGRRCHRLHAGRRPSSPGQLSRAAVHRGAFTSVKVLHVSLCSDTSPEGQCRPHASEGTRLPARRGVRRGPEGGTAQLTCGVWVPPGAAGPVGRAPSSPRAALPALPPSRGRGALVTRLVNF